MKNLSNFWCVCAGFFTAVILFSPPLQANEGTAPKPTPETILSPPIGGTASNPPRNSRIPYFQAIHPRWGFELSSSLNALGDLMSPKGMAPIYAFHLSTEYQPAFLQNYGVFGIGPSFALYPVFNNPITSNVASILSVGGLIRYQARYFREQPIVPVFAYAIDYLNYQFTNGASGYLILSGPVFGLWILLNFFEPSSAAQFYVDNGVARTYLILEARQQAGKSDSKTSRGPPATASDYSYYFGLRFEF